MRHSDICPGHKYFDGKLYRSVDFINTKIIATKLLLSNAQKISQYKTRLEFMSCTKVQVYKLPTSLMPSQSARSLALANAVDSPTTLTLCPVLADIKLVRDTTTSNTGPLSAPV